MALVSVILPVYNTEKYIAGAVQSILDQTFKDFELIIINDASTDSTLQILQGFNDPRIRLVSNDENLGLVKTLNKGFDLANGEFIARMDGDDIAWPHRFQKQVNFMQVNRNIDICGSWAYIFGTNDHISQPSSHHEDIKAQLLFINRIIHPSLLLRRQSLIAHNAHFDEEYIKCEDYGLWVKLIDKLQFSNVPEVLLSYRIHNENFSVPNEGNKSVLKKWNIVNYETLLQRAGVQYKQAELELHYNMAFSKKPLSKPQLLQCLQWLQKIVKANNKSLYFNQQSLCNEIIEQVILINRQTGSGGKNFVMVFTKLTGMFPVSMLIKYFLFKRNKTSNYHAGVALQQKLDNSLVI